MLPDLERLIRLQEIDSSTEDARQAIDGIPQRLQQLEAELEHLRAEVQAASHRLEASQTGRRALEKDAAAIQTRLSRYRDQLMEVKTNKEYHAMQKEIAVAEGELQSLEDRILERLLEADELSAALQEARGALDAGERRVVEERRTIDAERAALEDRLQRLAADRRALVADTGDEALALFDHVARMRRGIAVAEARDGLCAVCHVRLRPQVFNTVRRNESLMQCDSCHRILYFVAGPAGEAATS